MSDIPKVQYVEPEEVRAVSFAQIGPEILRAVCVRFGLPPDVHYGLDADHFAAALVVGRPFAPPEPDADAPVIVEGTPRE